MKEHWETIYQTKKPEEVSWTQTVPSTSLSLVTRLGLPKSASIIDIGGGDGRLVDHLLDEGYSNITVLDISERALERARSRLGAKGRSVKWITADVTGFRPAISYDLWHDRAAFHFLTSPSDVSQYFTVADAAIKENGCLIIGTFSTSGPKKCSGLDVTQYSEESLSALLANSFEKVECFTEDHTTPFGAKQNFLFCLFKRRAGNVGAKAPVKQL